MLLSILLFYCMQMLWAMVTRQPFDFSGPFSRFGQGSLIPHHDAVAVPFLLIKPIMAVLVHAGTRVNRTV